MTGPRRGRGRRDNGLDATLWTPLRDVDPRVGEHLLDVLETVGIAAYLEPSSDVGPYTRTQFLPSPPTDRLFVDRARTSEARVLVDQHADDHPDRVADRTGEPRARGPLPGAAPVRPDPGAGSSADESKDAGRHDGDDIGRDFGRKIDEDAEWARIVAAFEAENGRPAAVGEISDAPPPAPHEPAVLDRPDEHYEPPPAPPMPAPSPASLYSLLLIVAGIVLLGAPSLLGLSADVGLVLGVAAAGGGAAVLVSRMRERSRDDGDDGAVV